MYWPMKSRSWKVLPSFGYNKSKAKLVFQITISKKYFIQFWNFYCKKENNNNNNNNNKTLTTSESLEVTKI